MGSDTPDARAYLRAALDPQDPLHPAAMHWLGGIAREAAGFVHRGERGHQRDVGIAEACSLVWERLAKFRMPADAVEPNFRAWCRRVLGHRKIDGIRKESRRQAAESSREPRHWDETPPVPGAFFDEPFRNDDLEMLRGWSIKERTRLLLLAGLHGKVPAPLWKAWLSEAGFDPLRLPGDAWDMPEEPAERVAFLARTIGARPETLGKYWNRNKDRVARLPSVLRLRGGLA